VSAILIALTMTGTACASPRPALVPGWNDISAAGQAVDAAGRGIIVFGHGEHARAASVTPTGRVFALAKIAAPRAIDGPMEPQAAMGAHGRAVVTYLAFNGEQPEGRLGYGFVIRPWASRFRWGARPAPARRVQGGPVNVRSTQLAMRPDGTALLAYTANDGYTSIDASRVALLRPGRAASVRTLADAGGSTPEGLAIDSSDSFVTAWTAGGALEVFTGRGVQPTSQRYEIVGWAQGYNRHVFSSLEGDQAAVWQEFRAGVRDGPMRLATRPRAAAGFADNGLVAPPGRPLGAVAGGPEGDVSVLLDPADASSQHDAILISRTSAGRSRWSVHLGSSAGAFGDGPSAYLAVGADGATLAIYYASSRRFNGTRAVRVTAHGHVVPVAAVPDCLPLGLAGAERGPNLVTLGCPGGGTRLVGAVITLRASRP
jgi:hypothetical protein